jgi:hypothetical protein
MAKKSDPISEKEIADKTKVGLSREQAIEVIKNQREHDAALEEAEAAKAAEAEKQKGAQQ